MKRALIADDSKTMRDMVTAVLMKAGFEVISGVDGQDALRTLGDQDITVVTTDYNMPNMNGVELVQAIRAKEKYKYIPILLISSESDLNVKEQARQAGASGWVKKPFNPEMLISAINKLCG